jgi:hypothetical protein
MSNGRSEGAVDVWSIPQVSDQPTVERTPNRRRTSGSRISVPAGTSDAATSIEIVRRADRRTASVVAPAPNRVPASRSEIANRAVNIALASLALVALSPVIVVVAIAVKLTSRGDAVYSQTRVGLDRRMHATDAL